MIASNTGCKFERGAADNLKHLGSRCLLFERLELSSAVRACTSWNSRAFSIAITAWSAKVSTSSICAAENGPGTRR